MPPKKFAPICYIQIHYGEINFQSEILTIGRYQSTAIMII